MKKLNFYFAFAITLMAFSACSSGGPQKKEITPTSLEFTSGEIARYVEFVDEPCELSYSEKDGVIPTQTMRLKTKMRKIKEGFEEVDYHDMDFYKLISVAIVNLLDENNANIVDLDISSEGKLALKKLLTGKVGDETEVVFDSEFHNSEDAPKWYKDVKVFSPYLSGDIYLSRQSAESSVSDGNSDASVNDNSEESAFPTDNVILPSSLKGKVEVTNVEKGIGRFGFPEVSVTFKLLKKVNTSSLCSAGGQMWIVGVGQNEQGRDVKELLPNYDEWRSGDSDGSEFKDFLEGDPDDTITLEFTGSKDESNDVEADLEKVKKFKLKLTK